MSGSRTCPLYNDWQTSLKRRNLTVNFVHSAWYFQSSLYNTVSHVFHKLCCYMWMPSWAKKGLNLKAVKSWQTSTKIVAHLEKRSPPVELIELNFKIDDNNTVSANATVYVGANINVSLPLSPPPSLTSTLMTISTPTSTAPLPSPKWTTVTSGKTWHRSCCEEPGRG